MLGATTLQGMWKELGREFRGARLCRDRTQKTVSEAVALQRVR